MFYFDNGRLIRSDEVWKERCNSSAKNSKRNILGSEGENEVVEVTVRIEVLTKK